MATTLLCISPSASLSCWLSALSLLVVPPSLFQPFRLPLPTRPTLPLVYLLTLLSPFIPLNFILKIMQLPCFITILWIVAEVEVEVRLPALPSLQLWSAKWIFPWPWMCWRFLTLNTSLPIFLSEFLKPKLDLLARGLGRGLGNQLSLPLPLNNPGRWWLCPSNYGGFFRQQWQQ